LAPDNGIEPLTDRLTADCFYQLS